MAEYASPSYMQAEGCADLCAQPEGAPGALVEHGEIEISNTQIENAIRPFVIDRKEWLFTDTPQDA